MTIDNRIMIEFADWVLEVVDSGLTVNNALAQDKIAELVLKYAEEIEDEDDEGWEEDDDYNEDIGRGSPSLSKLILSEIELR